MRHNNDIHGRHLVRRLPTFFEIVGFLDPANVFHRRQRLLIGAFPNQTMVGTVGIERPSDLAQSDLTAVDEERFLAKFPQHELNAFAILQQDVSKTFLGAPTDSLVIHSLSVSSNFRQRGVARSLLPDAIYQLNSDEQQSLYIEIASLHWMQQFVESLGFQAVQKSFSLSERLQFGCWGAILMRHQKEQ